MSVFPGKKIPAQQADIWWNPHFLSASEADQLMEELRTTVAWTQGEVRMFGKWIKEPRLSAWYGDSGASYTYSGKRQEPLPWIPALSSLKFRLESTCDTPFNSVLLNLYRHGQDSMGWHSDNEPELGPRPLIASLNLGATRRFQFRRTADKSDKISLDLNHGSLLIMAGDTQHHWQHQVSKTRREVGERINLTFRKIL